MELRTQNLEIHVVIASRLNPESWASFAVVAKAPGFSVDFTTSLPVSSFTRFKSELLVMRTHIEDQSTAKLCGLEPGVYIELNSNGSGQIEGSYQFEFSTEDAMGAILSGTFYIDEIRLSALMRSVDTDIMKLRG